MIYTHIPDISCFYSDTVGDVLMEPTAHFEYEMLLLQMEGPVPVLTSVPIP